jgi:hypothetical protein
MPTLHHRSQRLETGISGWCERHNCLVIRWPATAQCTELETHCRHLEKSYVRQDRNSTKFVTSKWNQSLFIGFNSVSQHVTNSYTNLLNKTRSARYGLTDRSSIPIGATIFFFETSGRTAKAPRLRSNGNRQIFPGVKMTGRESDHSLPGTKFRNAWRLPQSPHCAYVRCPYLSIHVYQPHRNICVSIDLPTLAYVMYMTQVLLRKMWRHSREHYHIAPFSCVLVSSWRQHGWR